MDVTSQGILNVVGGILLALIAWIGNRLHDRQDKLEEDIRNKVGKPDFDKIVDKVEERFTKALDNQTRLIVQLFKGRRVNEDNDD